MEGFFFLFLDQEERVITITVGFFVVEVIVFGSTRTRSMLLFGVESKLQLLY